MDDVGSFAYAGVPSYAPTLELHAPHSVPEACVLRAFVPLPPSMYYDPYTAGIERTQRASAVHLGHLELERQRGWSEASEVEAEPRAWWERSEHASAPAPCTAACEYTGVLVELQPGERHVSVPLHMRYTPAELRTAGESLEPRQLWISELPAPLALVERPWRAATRAMQRVVESIRFVLAHSGQHYADTPLAGHDAQPWFFAACKAPDWTPIHTQELVPATHEHLLAELERQLPEGPLYAPRMPPVALSNTTLAVPAGDMALYPALQLLTCAALAIASCWVLRCIRAATSL